MNMKEFKYGMVFSDAMDFLARTWYCFVPYVLIGMVWEVYFKPRNMFPELTNVSGVYSFGAVLAVVAFFYGACCALTMIYEQKKRIIPSFMLFLKLVGAYFSIAFLLVFSFIILELAPMGIIISQSDNYMNFSFQMNAISMIGAFLCFVMFLFWLVEFVFPARLVPFYVFKGSGIMQAIEQSRADCKGGRGHILGFIIVEGICLFLMFLFLGGLMVLLNYGIALVMGSISIFGLYVSGFFLGLFKIFPIFYIPAALYKQIATQ